MTRVFLAGNSHMVALRAAAHRHGGFTAFPLGHGRFETTTFSEPAGKGVRFTVPEYAEKLARFADQETITPGFGTWGFLQINHNARVYQHPCWRRFEPASLARRGSTPVSDSVVRAIIDEDHTGVREFFEQLSTAGIDFFAISGPPPRRDHYAIEAGTRAEVVQHIDRLAREIWASWLATRQIDVVDPPEDCVDGDGFMLPEYTRKLMGDGQPDPHHANEQYGDLMIAKISAHLGTRAAQETVTTGIE